MQVATQMSQHSLVLSHFCSFPKGSGPQQRETSASLQNPFLQRGTRRDGILWVWRCLEANYLKKTPVQILKLLCLLLKEYCWKPGEIYGKKTMVRWFVLDCLKHPADAILSFSYNLMQIRDESSNMTLSMEHGRLWYRGLVISHSCWFNSPTARKWDTPSHFHTWFSRKGNGEPMLTCNSRSNSQAANITVLPPSREAAPFHKQNFSSWV